MIVLAHAFSRANAGDGLLVDLAIKRLEKLGINRGSCTVVALDASSFDDLPSVVQAPGDPWAKISSRTVGSTGLALTSMLVSARIPRDLSDLWASADAIVAVGGGYLHSGGLIESGGFLINHFVQMRLSARSSQPTVYLPQSVGPLNPPMGSTIRRLAGQIDAFCVRDDESFADLQPLPGLRRIPDMAVLELVDALPHLHPVTGDAIVVAPRRLSQGSGYDVRLRRLLAQLEDPILAIQADVPGSKSDRSFIEKLGYRPRGSLNEVLAGSNGGVAVSVRLHGALQAILMGWPSIHLAYDRKGWGAFADLGLGHYVFDARSFDVTSVLERIEELRLDPAPYWDHVVRSLDELTKSSRELDSILGSILT